jgi:uncharacterized damage-inducible protein DinB
MDAREYLIRQFRWLRRMSDSILLDTTDEHFNWTPPGTVSAISSIFVHMLTVEDAYIQETILGKPRLWDTQHWEEKIGSRAPWRGENWEDLRGRQLALEDVAQFQEQVRIATDAYLESITPEELDRRVLFLERERRVADVLAMLVVHNLGHAGEIAALKGVQGVAGLSF